MIEIENLKVRFGEIEAVRGLSLTIEDGMLYALLGPNGAGKTTTLRCLAGLQKPNTGTIRVDGRDPVTDPSSVRKLLGVVPQDLALYGTLNAVENLKVFGGLTGLSGKRLDERIQWALSLSQLKEQCTQIVETMSGGMKRRLNLAASLLHDPRIIICDEPTTGVDAQSRAHIFETLRALHDEGRTIVYTTHIMADVETLCTHVGIMDTGQLLLSGTLEELVKGEKRDHRFQLEVGDDVEVEDLRKAMEQAGIQLKGIERRARGLEEVFLDLTGHRLRDS